MAWVIPVAALALKAVSSITGSKAKKKQNDEQRRALIDQLTLAQKQREDARTGKFNLGASMLSRVPGKTGAGDVNTGVALDPEMVKQLGLQHTYDFASEVPDANKGATWALISGLFGDASKAVSGMSPAGALAGMGGGGNGVGSSQPSFTTISPNEYPGGMGNPNGSAPSNGLNWEDLYKLQGSGAE